MARAAKHWPRFEAPQRLQKNSGGRHNGDRHLFEPRRGIDQDLALAGRRRNLAALPLLPVTDLPAPIYRVRRRTLFLNHFPPKRRQPPTVANSDRNQSVPPVNAGLTYFTMAASLRGVSRSARALQPFSTQFASVRRCASTQAPGAGASAANASSKNNIPDLAELETQSALEAPLPSAEDKKEFRPWKRAADRKARLPSSRYQYHPPKYNRGPLHPIQSPPSSDPIARDFVPGPFNMPRLKESFRTVLASDLMTLAYIHVPPGTPKKEPTERLRSWEGDSPYFANRARRAPRGAPELPIRERDITFRNIPEIKEITVSTFVPLGLKNPDMLIVARAVLLAMTGSMPEMTRSKNNVVQWQLQANKTAGCKTTIYGNAAWEFLDRLVHLVFPRIKDWKGVRGTTGDGSGNVQFGLNPEDVQLFPEVEVNYDMYPAKMIPGCHIAIKTTATSDRQAKLLLQGLGIPFYSA